MQLLGSVMTRFVRKNGGDEPLRQTGLVSLAVANVEPQKADLARANRRFGGVVGNGATFKAPITAYPTTTATWFLYNGEGAGGRSYFIDTVAFFLASGTAGLGAALIVAVTQQAMTTIPSAYASTIISSLSGGAKATKAVLANNITIPGTQPAWVVVAAQDSGADTAIGYGALAKVEGGILIPPGFGMAIDVLSSVGTSALYGVSVTWDEMSVDLE